jgi:hypothetical protein
MICERMRVLFGCVVLVVGVAVQGSLADTIASWNFDSLTLIQPVLNIPADSGTGTITMSGLTHLVREGNGSPHSLAFSDVDPGEYVQIESSTLGQSDIGVQWFQNGSANVTPTWDFQYSTDGLNFVTFLNDYDVPPLGAWQDDQVGGTSFSVNLSSVAALNNQANVWFRFTAVDDGNDLGLNQIDDVVVVSQIPEPATLSLLALGGLTLLRRHRSYSKKERENREIRSVRSAEATMGRNASADREPFRG